MYTVLCLYIYIYIKYVNSVFVIIACDIAGVYVFLIMMKHRSI